MEVGVSTRARPRAVILGCAGEELSSDESRFFSEADPLGFILFRRNCVSPAQVRRLVDALRGSVGRADAPVLIDQEGGRVARLRPPYWRRYPSAAQIATLPDPFAGEAARLGARLIADDLAAIGITVDCLPVLDLPVDGADQVIGDRAYGGDPERVVPPCRRGLRRPPRWRGAAGSQTHSRSRPRSRRQPLRLPGGRGSRTRCCHRPISRRFGALAGNALGDDRSYRLPRDRPRGAGDVFPHRHRRNHSRRDRFRRRADLG